MRAFSQKMRKMCGTRAFGSYKNVDSPDLGEARREAYAPTACSLAKARRQTHAGIGRIHDGEES